MNNMSRISQRRKGASTVVIVLLIAFFVVLPLSLMAFEIGRMVLAQQELKNVSDSAALSGTAALASSPQGMSVAQLHDLAMQVAEQTFEQNSILSTPFNTVNVVANRNNGTRTTNPAPQTAVLNITLLDQNGTPQPTGSSTATTMQIESFFNAPTAFPSHLLPIAPSAIVRALSNGGLPELDIFLCFDVSGSMDDQTPVQFVRRYWDPGAGYVNYSTVRSGNIYDSTNPPKTGTGLNVARPQNLAYASYPSPSNGIPQIFSEGAFPAPNNLLNLRGNQFTYPAGSLPSPIPPTATKYPTGTLTNEQGWPPGNFDPTLTSNLNGNGVNPNSYANGFTDMIAQVPDMGGFTFPNIQTCLEASRGNMESVDILKQSQGGGTVNPSLPTPRPGYYNAYWSQVENNIAQPITDARRAASNFYYIMNVSANSHFGLETFADQAGTSRTSVWNGTTRNVDRDFPHAGTGSFPVPLIALHQTNSNYVDARDAINGTGTFTKPIGPTGATNISDAMKEAIDELIDNSKTRSTAKRAIVLFTDGTPNLPGGEGPAKSACITQARRAKGAGIPVYTIGLSQNNAITGDQDALLGDNRNGSGKGIAFESGNGAIYIRVNNSRDLDKAFQTIARSLVVLRGSNS